jgi:hypothetical protein
MIFQNPWAWLGLLAIAAPVVAHLLARRPARRQLFPDLRFLPAAAHKPIRRDRLTDLWLLLLRGGVIAAAVVALTQPLWLSAARARDLGGQIARAIIVDTSASMQRAAAGGGRAIEAARRQAGDVAAGSTLARVGETAAPASLLDGAVAWLSVQPMRRELVVISDFQPAAIAGTDLQRVPADIGVRTIAIALDAAAAAAPAAAAPASGPADGVRLLAGAAERAGVAAARSAAIVRGAPAAGRHDRPVALVFPQFEGRDALLKASSPIDEPWMFDVLMAVRSDPTLRAAAARAGKTAAGMVSARLGAVEGTERLLLFTSGPAHHLTSAAIVAATMRGVADVPAPAESAMGTLDESERAGWHRPPAEAARPGARLAGDQSDGRWWWLAALALLIGETIVRRTRPAPAEREAERARVA